MPVSLGMIEEELGHRDRKRIHNLKYFTWVEQMGKDPAELDRQWSDGDCWTERYESYRRLDDRIAEFNGRTGLIEGMTDRDR